MQPQDQTSMADVYSVEDSSSSGARYQRVTCRQITSERTGMDYGRAVTAHHVFCRTGRDTARASASLHHNKHKAVHHAPVMYSRSAPLRARPKSQIYVAC